MYLVVVDTTPDNKIAKYQEYETRVDADAHVARVLPNYPSAFVVDNPTPYVVDYTTVDVVAKTLTYDSVGYNSDTVMNDWKSSMQGTDNGMPRYLEDIFNRDGTDGLPQALIDKYNTKKDLRATKP